MPDTVLLMDAVNDLSSLLSAGESIESIFGAGSDGLETRLEQAMQQMLSTLLTEIKQVFLDDLTQSAIQDAAGVAQAAHDFLAVDYANAQHAGETQAQLWTLLTSDTSTTRLSDLVAQAAIMLGWASTDSNLAQQTLSLALTIYALIVAMRRERAANAPDSATRTAEQNDMAQYAGFAVTRLGPAIAAVATARQGAIGAAQHSSEQVSFKSVYYFWAYTVNDAWPAAQPFGVVLTVGQHGSAVDGPHTEDPALKQQMVQARGLYQQLCQGGTDAQMSAWSAALTSAVGGGYFIGNPTQWQEFNKTFSAPTIVTVLPSLVAMGKWLTQAQAAINNFKTISAGASRSA